MVESDTGAIDDRPVPAVVIGTGGPNTLAICRSLGRRGVPTSVIAKKASVLRASRYCHHVVPVESFDHTAHFGRALLLLADRLRQRPVLFSCSDESTRAIARVTNVIQSRYRPVVDPVRAASLLDKALQHELAKAAGVDLPRTHVLTEPGDLDVLREGFPFPAICKPTGDGVNPNFAWKTLTLHDAKDARAKLLPCLAMGNGKIIIQEFIGGEDSDVLFCLAVCRKDGSLWAAMTGRKLRQYPPDAGVMASGVSESLPRVLDASQRLFRAAGLGGLIGVEYKQDPVSGRIVLIEISTRSDNFIGIAPASGVDLPYLAYLRTLGRHLPPIPAQRDDVKWICGMLDFSSARKLIAAKRLSWPDYLWSLRGQKTWAIFTPEDPMPFVSSFVKWLLGRLGIMLSRTHD